MSPFQAEQQEPIA